MRSLPGILTSLLLIGSAAASEPQSQVEMLDEVVVVGQVELNRMFQELINVEEQFFARFNELNTVDDFDTYCHIEAHIGSKIRRRYCRAVYEDKAYRKEGDDYVQFLQRGSSGVAMGGPPQPAHVDIQMRREEYRKNMLDVVNKHPELQELARKRYEMGKRYDEVRRKTFGLDPPPAEQKP